MHKDKEIDMDGLDIDKFGEIIDEHLRDKKVQMLITLPEGSLDPDIKCSFSEFSVMEFYIMLYGLEKVVKDVVRDANVDPDKLGIMLDAILGLVKDQILKEAADDTEK